MLEEQMKAYRKQIEILNSDIKEKENEIFELKKEQQDKSAISDIDSELLSLKNKKIDELENEKLQISDRLSETINEYNELSTANEMLKKELEEIKKDNDDLKKNISKNFMILIKIERIYMI